MEYRIYGLVFVTGDVFRISRSFCPVVFPFVLWVSLSACALLGHSCHVSYFIQLIPGSNYYSSISSFF